MPSLIYTHVYAKVLIKQGNRCFASLFRLPLSSTAARFGLDRREGQPSLPRLRRWGVRLVFAHRGGAVSDLILGTQHEQEPRNVFTLLARHKLSPRQSEGFQAFGYTMMLLLKSVLRSA